MNMMNMRLLSRLSFIIAILLSSSTSLHALGESPQPLISLTQAEKEWLTSHPNIRLAPDPEFAPIEYFDRDGVYQGVAADHIKLLEQKLGVRFFIVKAKNWDEVMEKFRNNEIDALGAIVATPKRRTFMRISDPLFNVPGAIMVQKRVDPNLTFDKLKGLKVAVVSNYTAHDIMKEQYPDIQLEVVPSTTAGLTKVSFGMVDAYVENLATASYYMQEAAISNVHVAGSTPFAYQWGIGIRMDWPELESIINKGIATISNDERHSVLNHWLPVQQHWEPSREFIIMALVTAGVTFVLVILVSNWVLRRKVAQRTEALNKEIEGHLEAEEEIRLLNTNLEQRVIERTTELQKEVEERKRAEQSLFESKSRYQMLVDNLPLGITLINADHRIIMTNAMHGKWFNKDPAQFQNKYCYAEFEKREQTCHHCPGVVSMKTGMPAEVETVGVRDDGSYFSVKIITVPLGPIESPTGFIEVVEDITERKKAEEEQQKLREQLTQSLKMEAVGLLAGGIAHDFNNILTIIIGFAELIQMRTLEGDPNIPHVEQILTASAKAAALTQQLLAFSRKQIVNPQPVAVNLNIQRLEKLLRRLIGEDIDFKVICAEEPLVVFADAGQLDQVIINLSTNARDAMPTGGTLLIHITRSELDEGFVHSNGFSHQGDYALIEISDSGVGMDEKTRQRIFEPFFTTKGVGKGTGLGLSTVYGIVKQCNGHINCYSEPGKGTTFRIYLPLVPEAESTQEQSALDVTAISGDETVLIAEDDEQIRILNQKVLASYGYTVLCAADGQEAVERFREHQDEINLVILDVIMPKMNGKEALDEIRKIQPDIRVLFTSGYTAEIIHQRSVLDQSLPFLSKPASTLQLLQKVREVLDTQASK
ncbi:MAG: transporter substrate-binding domain-containing protein [Desulfobulbaceae bacterium]|nr:transporter substrate-binding domain-containing protein [Desulfobulbaceae bacterium]